MKNFFLLFIITVFFTGCEVDLKNNATEKIKSDLTNSVTKEVKEKVQEGVATGVQEAKEQVIQELNAKEIKIGSNEITPKELTVIMGQETKLKITVSDNKTHGFYLPDLEITETIKPGETEIITIKPEKTGTFSYSCNINCENIIVGNLIVK